VRRLPEGIPHILIWCSSRHIKGQVIDKAQGKVFAEANTLQYAIRSALYDGDMTSANLKSYKTGSVHAAQLIGQALAKKCIELNITSVRWERTGRYAGKIAAFIDAVRDGGIKLV